MTDQTRPLKRLLALIVGFALVGVGTRAWAIPTPFDLVGVNDPNLIAHVEFEYFSSTATVSIDVLNTSLAAAGPDPRLTSFAFNVPANVTGVQQFVSGPSGWSLLFDRNNIDTPGQFGLFDLAAITGPNFSGGDPNDGIPRASTPTNFQFVLAGSNLGLLTTDSFLSLLSLDPPGPPQENPQFFIARFQRTGPGGGGSDVAIPGQPGPPSPIPEPGTLLLIGSGLVGLGAGVWRRKKP